MITRIILRTLILATVLSAGLAAPTSASAGRLPSAPAATGPTSTATRVVVLGVDHTAMLVSEAYQPAVLRAFIGRVAPDAVCIERPPEEFARGDHYEFTYEIQDVAVPYARARRIPLCPFDWIPDVEDQRLAFGIDLSEVPFRRRAAGYPQFLTFPDPAALTRGLFFAEDAAARQPYIDWYTTMPERPRGDFARRLFLYRTFLQAMRIAHAAKEFPGGTVLVIVGAMHKEDIERILADEPGIEVVAPTEFGHPTAEEIEAETRIADLAAVATFNLLGAQSATGNVDWAWMERVVARLRSDADGPEARLLETRLRVLTGELDAAAAAEAYARIRAEAPADLGFTWNGVIDRRRLDSFADPFANLTIARRATLEQARAYHAHGRHDDADRLRQDLRAALPPLRAAQLDAYWGEWVHTERTAARGSTVR